MSYWLSQLFYTFLQCLTGAYAAAVFLTTRPISVARAWVLGLVVASLLTLGTAMTSRIGLARPNVGLIAASSIVYFVPTIVLVATALSLRSRRVSRNVGVGVIVALFLVVAAIARYLAPYFLFGVVNAVQ
jgi:hypothetical protein